MEEFYIIVTNFEDKIIDIYGMVNYNEGYLCANNKVSKWKEVAIKFNSEEKAIKYAKEHGKVNFRIAKELNLSINNDADIDKDIIHGYSYY